MKSKVRLKDIKQAHCLKGRKLRKTIQILQFFLVISGSKSVDKITLDSLVTATYLIFISFFQKNTLHSVSGYCENDDPCSSINQTCIPLFNSYRCQCPEGESCIQTTTIPETSSTLVCSDQTCINGQCSESNLCQCTFGYEGDNCDINTDDCTEKPCFNDAECVDLVGDFTCQCGPDYR